MCRGIIIVRRGVFQPKGGNVGWMGSTVLRLRNNEHDNDDNNINNVHKRKEAHGEQTSGFRDLYESI